MGRCLCKRAFVCVFIRAALCHHAHAYIWHCSSRSELRRIRAAESAAAIARRHKMLSLCHQVRKGVGEGELGEGEEGREGRRDS